MNTINRNLTKRDLLKNRIVSGFSQLLAEQKENIETGIEERIYDANDNVKTLRWIAKMENAINEFSKSSPTVYVFVEGGNIQGASANCDMQFEIYDKDNLEAGTIQEEQQYIEDHGTLEEWDKMIKTRTHQKELKPVY